jgi:hypothetical protein
MIGGRKDPLAALASAVAALDFGAENEALAKLRAEHADLQAKRDAVRAEIQSLSEQVANWTGPNPALVAEAIMAGKSPAEAASVGVSRVELEGNRDALVASVDLIRERIDRLADQIWEAESAMTARIAEAVAPYVAHIEAQQRAAGEVLVQSDAALIALASVTNRRLDPDRKSQKAREGVTGKDSLLGWRDVIEPPPELLAALRPLAEKCAAVKGIPTAIGTR